MTEGPDNGPNPPSEPETRQIRADSTGPDQLWERVPTNPMPPPEGFAAVEGPTLNSPSSEPQLVTLVTLEARVRTLEHHLEETERELADVYGAVEQLARSQETIDRALSQQRYGRYIMWGTLIAILTMLWLTLRSRLGMLGSG